MKKITWSIGCLALLLLSNLLTACGGLHDSNSIHAKNLITNESISIPLKVHNTANTGHFSNFTSPLDYDEMAEKLRIKNHIINVTDFNYLYLRLETDSGEFYLKYNGRLDDEYRYSLFAEVGKASDFGKYIYVPFHMLRHYPQDEYPAAATPFEGDVYYDNTQYTFDDFAAYYEDKDIYSVEENKIESMLIVTDKSNSYSFKVKVQDYGDYGFFDLEDDYSND